VTLNKEADRTISHLVSNHSFAQTLKKIALRFQACEQF